MKKIDPFSFFLLFVWLFVCLIDNYQIYTHKNAEYIAGNCKGKNAKKFTFNNKIKPVIWFVRVCVWYW